MPQPTNSRQGKPSRPWGRGSVALERYLRHALEGLRYGSVELVVHDSVVVQIIRTERLKIEELEHEPDES